jgi:N6-adenosine-specific RNA methylase IME4
MSVTTDLDRLVKAERLLAQAATVIDALNVVDFAEAARVYAQRAKLGTRAVNHATTVKLRAERRLADMVDAGQDAGTIATAGKPHAKPPDSGGLAPPSTLASLGVNDRRLAEARTIRDSYTDEAILATAADADLRDVEMSRKELLKTATRRRRQEVKRVAVEKIEQSSPVPLDLLGPFPVLYADPPWRYEYAEDASRQIENHYPTMTLDEIKGLDVPAADDSVLFLWVTSPKLVEGLEVVDAWGFEYRTCMVWVKDKIGMGYYARQQHELLLVAKRGSLPVPDPEDRPSSVITAPRVQHSAKPDVVYELIERMYPLRDKCELFQRRPRLRWAGWGNQTP